MEKKKSPSANLEKKRSVFLQTGFVASIAFVLAAFGWTSYDLSNSGNSWRSNLDILILEDDIVPIHIPEKPEPKKSYTPLIDKFELVIDDPIDPKDKPDPEPDPEPEFNFDLSDYGTSDEVPDIILRNGNEVIDFMVVEKRPHFKSCENMLDPNAETQCTYLEIVRWVNSHARYPQRSQLRGTQGVVNVSFIIDEKGQVVDVKAENEVDPDLEKEAIRVVKSLPEFIPGSQQGRKVKVPYRIPVKFVIK